MANIRGIKIIYPSNGADLKGLIKAAYLDPNPVVMLEHKGLYWSKVSGTSRAKVIEPSEDYILPLGKANVVQSIEEQDDQDTMTIVTYGMGVHWSMNATEDISHRVEIIDLRTISPLDIDTIIDSVNKTKKCLVVTEEPSDNTFGRSLCGMIQEKCFKKLDGPVMIIGSENMPAIPLNSALEKAMIPSADKVRDKVDILLAY